ncbi:SPOR domain-containing protein [Sphingomonas sp. MA1305]|uniref:SPOR domain-containing protein n=1 Tax=Sphingomonas sp. MA1305 TaxID=2479204 RepID=UPI002FCCF0F8
MMRFAKIMPGIGVAAGLMLAVAPAVAQNVKAGVDAWGRGDYKTAVDQWRGPAVAGDPDAQFNLGQAYKLGRGVPLDPVLAESWFRKAAVQGHFQAQDNYGLALFQAGKKADAAPWLEKSAARGEPRAQLVLGTMLFNGDGLPVNYPRAYALMTLAAQSKMAAAAEPAAQTLAQMDQYITPADRERGTALAQQMAAQYRMPAGPAAGMPTRAVASADVPPSRVEAERPRPRPAPRTPAPDRPVPDRIVEQPVQTRPAPHRPAPAAERSTPAPVAAPAAGGWRIQLGAFSSQANAEAQWAKVRGRLGAAKPVYARAGTLTRLQAGGFASKAAAQRACSASGVSCVVVAP